ncbi:HD domain-containing protein [Geopseudomonas aromaticivorans]
MRLSEKARLFALAAFAATGQRRKYTDESYFAHAAAVVALVAGVTLDETALAAAWLHDVVEDTGITLDLIEREFGAAVASLVGMLTNASRPSDGNRAQRKAIDREHLAGASALAKTIKLADMLDNLSTVVDRDPEFARTYLPEKALMLEQLTEGDAGLWQAVHDVIASGLQKLQLLLGEDGPAVALA